MWMDEKEELAQYINRLHEKLQKKFPNITKEQTRYIVFCILDMNEVEQKLEKTMMNVDLVKIKKDRKVSYKPVFRL